jgi:acyl carrier protein
MNESIPQGIEVLVKKAAVDPAFKATLLERRAEAARQIGLELSPGEAALLATVPTAQLEAIIARTNVPQEHRRAFLGQAAAAMLAALGMASGAVAASAPKEVRAVPAAIVVKPVPKPIKTVEQRVIDVIDKQFNPTKPPADPKDKPTKVTITRETALVKDLGATPAGLIKLKQSLEEEFDIAIPGEDYKKIETVDQAIQKVEEVLKKKGEGLMKPRPNPGPVARAVRIERRPIENPRPDVP